MRMFTKVGIMVLVASLVFSTWIYSRNAVPLHQVNTAGFNKICERMTESEVEGILGVSFGQHFSGTAETWYRRGGIGSQWGWSGREFPKADLCCIAASANGEVYRTYKGWIGDELAIWIAFDADSRVLYKEAFPVYRYSEIEVIFSQFRRFVRGN